MPLTSFNIVSQLDNFATKSVLWTGNLMSLDTVSVLLDTINFVEGKHKLKASLIEPNGLTDENPVNDTISIAFEYRQCGETFEPNNTISTATPIPFDTKFHQPISSSNDLDYYTFTTTSEARVFEVALTNLPAAYALSVIIENGLNEYYDYTFTTKDKNIKFSALPNQKVHVVVSAINFSSFIADKCYTLEVKKLPIKLGIALEKIYRPDDSLVTSAYISPLVKVRNTGNVDLESLTFTYKIDENTPKTFNWKGFIKSNDTAAISLPPISDYTEGVHNISISVNTTSNSPDSNLTNNTLSTTFKYQKRIVPILMNPIIQLLLLLISQQTQS
ncbi:MAG: hypothetical protein HC817_09885 [Saprospiraceae bacterium]|nr:hypothetical protein [Saprospiraceae bacterium]